MIELSGERVERADGTVNLSGVAVEFETNPAVVAGGSFGGEHARRSANVGRGYRR
jgi:hypothetical protein